METRAYSICRRCAAPYPERRRCPACDGDLAAAGAIAAATAHAQELVAPVPGRSRARGVVVTGVLAFTVVAGLAIAAIAALSS